MDFMFADPTMLDDMDFLFKSDLARRLMFYHQEEWKPDPPVDRSKLGSRERHDDTQRPNLLKIQGRGKQKETGNTIGTSVRRSSGRRSGVAVQAVDLFIFIFFFPLSTFLIKGVLLSKNLFRES